MRISCLHTNADHISYYEAATPEGVKLAHFLRPERSLCGNTPAGYDGLNAEIRAQLLKMREGSDAVLTACALLAPYTTPPEFAADHLLADDLAERCVGRRVEIFHSNPLADEIVADIYGRVAGAAELRLSALPEAWEALRYGDRLGHDGIVRSAIGRSAAEVIALTDPAMAPMAGNDPRILSGVAVALERIVAAGTGTLHRKQAV